MVSGLAEKIAKLQTAFGRIALLPAQETRIILRSSFGTPCLMHFLRCSPCFDHPLLNEHDAVLREGLSAIVNIHTMATSQYSCEELWLGDSTSCVACTSSILGVCSGHFGSPMLHPLTLLIVRRTLWRSLIDSPAPLGSLESSERAWMRPCWQGTFAQWIKQHHHRLTEPDCLQQHRPLVVNVYLRYP